MQAGCRRFDSVRLHQISLRSLWRSMTDLCIVGCADGQAPPYSIRLDRKAVSLSRPVGRRDLRIALHRSERITALLAAPEWGCSGRETNDGVVQVKYTNQVTAIAVAGIDTCFDGRGIAGPAEGPGSRSSDARSFFFRIKSSAIRAFGGCLGSKRR